MLAGFHAIAQRRLKHAFRALRVAHASRAILSNSAPVVVYLNHPSWWDPLVGFVLARRLFGSRNFYAPMDSKALARYWIFRRLGMFPVELQQARGAAQFLQQGQAVLNAGHVLAVTPQGQFTDIRERPVRLKSGLATLLHRRQRAGQDTTVLPIALEYTFWNQRLPEALVNCGQPMKFSPGNAFPSRDEVNGRLEDGLTRAQDELALLAQLRDPASFESLLQGSKGTSGFYGAVEKVRAAFGGGRGKSGDHRFNAG